MRGEVSLDQQKVVPFFPDSEYPLTLPGKQLLVSVWRHIPEHKVMSLIYHSIMIFKRSGGQNTHSALICGEKKSISFRRTPIVEERGLTLKLEVCAPVHPSYQFENTIGRTWSIMHYKMSKNKHVSI